jgi:integrase
MRKGEILSLKWEQIRNGFIYLRETKTKEPRQVPVNDDLDLLFKRIRQQQQLTSPYVFTYYGKPVGSVEIGFTAALKRAGVVGVRFHDLRHTFASHFVMRGGSLKELQEILGHKTMAMTLRYAHLSQKHKKKAVNLLNGLTGRLSQTVTFPAFSEKTTL